MLGDKLDAFVRVGGRDFLLRWLSHIFTAYLFEWIWVRARSTGWRLRVKQPPSAASFEQSGGLHIFDDGRSELAGLQLCRAHHLAVQIVSHALLLNGLRQRVNDFLADFAPAHVLEHHNPRQN